MPLGDVGAASAAAALIAAGGPFHLRLGLSFAKIGGVAGEPAQQNGYTRHTVSVSAAGDTVTIMSSHNFTFGADMGKARAWSIHNAAGGCLFGGALKNQINLTGQVSLAAGSMTCQL